MVCFEVFETVCAGDGPVSAGASDSENMSEHVEANGTMVCPFAS